MTPIAPVSGVAPTDAAAAISNAAPKPSQSFMSELMDGVQAVDAKIKNAEALARSFGTDDSVPVHQVVFAMEEARFSLEMMIQVRNRLVESGQELLRMQL